MEKINFINGQAPAINGTNLNQMQDNTENAINDVKQNDIITDGEAVKCGYKVDGKDVYIKRINLGSLPNSTSKDVLTGIPIAATIVDINASAVSGTNLILIPLTNNSNSSYQVALTMYQDTTYWGVRIATGMDRSGFTGYANIYFTN